MNTKAIFTAMVKELALADHLGDVTNTVFYYAKQLDLLEDYDEEVVYHYDDDENSEVIDYNYAPLAHLAAFLRQKETKPEIDQHLADEIVKDHDNKVEIFKVQRPYITNYSGSNNILIYNKSRSVLHEMEATEDILKQFNGELRIYLEMDVDIAEKRFDVIKRVEEQSW